MYEMFFDVIVYGFIISGIKKIGDIVITKKIEDKVDEFTKKRKINKSKNKGNYEKNENYNHIKILTTAMGHPNFSYDKTIRANETQKEFYLKFPETFLDKLTDNRKDFNIKEDKCYRPISEIGDSIGVTDFEEKLEKCRHIVAEKFINREDGMYFNGPKYGILHSDAFSRTVDKIESPILHIEVYKTDYFTHSVMGELVKQLRKEDKLPDNLRLEDLNGAYNIFRTSMGLSLIVEIPETNQIILTKRSKNSSYSEGENWIYPSITEAMSFTDKDDYENKIDFELWAKRGLFEELGLDSSMYKKDSIKFYDMFFEKYFYQDNITASIELKDGKTFKDVVELKGKDHYLELESIFVIDLDKKSITEFIKKNKSSMRAQTLYTLQSYLERKHIKIDKTIWN